MYRKDRPARGHKWEYRDKEDNVTSRKEGVKAKCLSCGVIVRIITMYDCISPKGYHGWSEPGTMKKYRGNCLDERMNEALS